MHTRKYERPNRMKEAHGDKREAWGIAHSAQSNLGYWLLEMERNAAPINNHALKLALLHLHRELDDIKLLLWGDAIEEERSEI